MNAGISPAKSKKFLERLAIQLDADVEITEEGKIYLWSVRLTPIALAKAREGAILS